MNREIKILVAKRNGTPLNGFSLIAVIFEIPRAALDFNDRFPEWFAAFQRQQPRDFVTMSEQEIAHLAHHPPAFNRPQAAQLAAADQRPSSGDCRVHIGRIGDRLVRNPLPGRRVNYCQLTATTGDPLAADVVFANHRVNSRSPRRHWA